MSTVKLQVMLAFLQHKMMGFKQRLVFYLGFIHRPSSTALVFSFIQLFFSWPQQHPRLFYARFMWYTPRNIIHVVYTVILNFKERIAYKNVYMHVITYLNTCLHLCDRFSPNTHGQVMWIRLTACVHACT